MGCHLEGEGHHCVLLVLVVGVHFFLEVLPENLGVGVKDLYVLLAALAVVEGVLCALMLVWAVESVLKGT